MSGKKVNKAIKASKVTMAVTALQDLLARPVPLVMQPDRLGVRERPAPRVLKGGQGRQGVRELPAGVDQRERQEAREL